MLVIGVDAATWKMIEPNLKELPNFRNLMEEGETGTMKIRETLLSPAIWCSMFSGKYEKEHGHKEYVKDGDIVKREDIPVDFIWDILSKKGYDVKALNVPFVVPPYNYNIDFDPISYGLPTTPEEWEEELKRVSEKTKEIMEGKPDLMITVFTSLDRIQHFHWGEDMVLDWYKKLDKKLGELVGLDDRVLVVSDHGFCNFGDAEIQTLPKETAHGKLRGDHHEDAIFIKKNMEGDIKEPEDVFRIILKNLDKFKND